MEDDFAADTARQEEIGIDQIAVELKTGIIEDEVDASAIELADELPNLLRVVSEDVGLGAGEVIPSGGLESLDVLLAPVHVISDEKRCLEE